MTAIVLEAQARTDVGKGASRRLRRLNNQVPGIIYGSGKKPESIMLDHHKIIHALEDERTYTTVLNIHLKNKVEKVILKDLQRHPYQPTVLHMDFQRVSDQDILVKHVPVHFLNEDNAPGLALGGIFNHTMTQIEVRCKVKDLPAFIEVDVGALTLNDVIHLSQLTLPAKVELTIDVSDPEHDFPVVSIHLPKVIQEPEPEKALSEEGEEVAPEEGAEAITSEAHEDDSEAPAQSDE